MQRAHKIELSPTKAQIIYFNKACGAARRVWNWALNEWEEQFQKGLKPNAMKLKKQFNAIKYQLYPWLREIHRDAHSQPFAHLDKAYKKFFNDIRNGQPAHAPKKKKKGRCRDSFYVANDKSSINNKTIKLPRIGLIKMTESLRFAGKILGATVSRIADRWYISIQVEVSNLKPKKIAKERTVVGLDVGIKNVATLSNQKKFNSPKPLTAKLRRLQILSRSSSRKFSACKKSAGFQENTCLTKGALITPSKNLKKSQLKQARLHRDVVNLRKDFAHKLTTQLVRENQAIVIEDLNIKGMIKNRSLSRVLSDVSLSEIRMQLEYKAELYGCKIYIAPTWYPSSKMCSHCNAINSELTLKDREWNCKNCHTHHDRDVNAALNLERLARVLALPEASQLVTIGAEVWKVHASGGKVTLVRYECGQKDASGQELSVDHFRSHL